MDDKNRKIRRLRTIINHILSLCLFFALFFVRTIENPQVPAQNTNEPSVIIAEQKTLIVAVYDEIEDGRYIMLDYLGALLRGIGVSETDTILINNMLSDGEQDKVFDKAMIEYVTSNNQYSRIVAVGIKSMDYAIDAKHLYYPSADLYGFGLNCNEQLARDYVCESVSINTDCNDNVASISHVVEDIEKSAHEKLVDKTVEYALELHSNKDEIIIVSDGSEYCKKTINLIFDNSLTTGKSISIVSNSTVHPEALDFSNSIILFTAYPKDFDVIVKDFHIDAIGSCFDISDVSDITNDIRFIHPMRYIDLECNHSPIVVLGSDNDTDYIVKDAMENVLLSCIGLKYDELWAYKGSSMNAAQFVNYGMMYEDVGYFGDSALEQARYCYEQNLVIPRKDIELGNLVYFSKFAYPGISEVDDVAVYFGYETVLWVNEEGVVVCTKPVDEKYHAFYADLSPLLPY